jgi:hypothetical protein
VGVGNAGGGWPAEGALAAARGVVACK